MRDESLTGNNDYLAALRQYFGFDNFRGIQREIVESIGSGRDTLGLMPTGGGKSITFQVPALASQGVCIVITPLIALMKDQVYRLRQRGIKAAAVYSGMSHDEVLTTLENAVFGAVKILYISPERIASPLFQAKLQHMDVSFITVDEAHCISQWGYDFRPAYLTIADIRRIKPDAPVLALTATATPRVIDDIQEKLAFRAKNVIRMSFARPNLAYMVRNTNDKREELLRLLTDVDGAAIVYARSRRRTKEIADMLRASGISSTFYHAGLDTLVRDAHQREWTQGRVRVIVATNAFGMGIDKPDVRLVAHVDCPDSLEAYFQEAGRAGRDGKQSYAYLLYNDSNAALLRRRVGENYPDKDFIADVYEHLAYFFGVGIGSGYDHRFEFDLQLFCRTYHFFPVYVDAALRLLTRAGYIYYDATDDSHTRLMFRVDRDRLSMLNALNDMEQHIVTTLLRSYSGMFSGYRYISLDDMAQLTGYTSEQVYVVLKTLDDRRIVSFIPQRSLPLITYTQSREEADRIVLPPEVYDDRKRMYAERIESMIDYATNRHVCRSRYLLRYFGETTSTDCGQCDVCRKEHNPTDEQLRWMMAEE